MSEIPIKQAKSNFAETIRRAEAGETVVVMRHGKPVFDIVPHKTKGGLENDAGNQFHKSRAIRNPLVYIADDFDDPLPEDFLLKPLP